MAQILDRKPESKPVAETPLFDWRKHLKVHPAAELFPLLPEAELKELAADIEAHGLQNLVTVWRSDGSNYLLDGRNRLDALALLGFLCADSNGGWIASARFGTGNAGPGAAPRRPFTSLRTAIRMNWRSPSTSIVAISPPSRSEI
jgi:hypothetical protein